VTIPSSVADQRKLTPKRLLLQHIPYAVLYVVPLGLVAMTSHDAAGTSFYWQLFIGLVALVSIVAGWRFAGISGHPRLVYLLKQVLHWGALVLVIRLLSGLVSILLGGMIIAQWPASGLWVIGLFVAIELKYSRIVEWDVPDAVHEGATRRSSYRSQVSPSKTIDLIEPLVGRPVAIAGTVGFTGALDLLSQRGVAQDV